MTRPRSDHFVLTTLVTGLSAQVRENTIARLLQEELVDNMHTAMATMTVSAIIGAPAIATPAPTLQAVSTPRAADLAILLEGLPAPDPILPTGPGVQSVRIAPGCVCCNGNLVMQVTLNRLLRSQPRRLFIALASTAHLDAIKDFLARPPYDTLLQLTPLVAA